MTSDSSKAVDFPVELIDIVKNFQGNLGDLEEVLRPFLKVSRTDLHDNKGLTALEKAELDCLSAFAFNSLVWMWLRTKGLNPKETEVKSELDRVKKSMLKLKEIQDKDKRNKVDQGAAKRLVASGLWKPGEAKKRHPEQPSSNAKRSKWTN